MSRTKAHKLTTNQLHHLGVISRNPNAYIECGKCKPFNRNTMDSLVRHGLITGELERRLNLFVNVNITEEGRIALGGDT